MAKKIIKIKVDNKMTITDLINEDGHTFSFNPNSKIGEELTDFIHTCKDYSSDMSEIPNNHKTGAKNSLFELIGNPEQFNFTKGEWIAERKSEYQTCHLVKTGDKYTVHVYDSKYGIHESESWGNAVLISKAPELLNMLIKLLKHIKDDELEEISHFPMLREAYDLIQDISIKKINNK